MNFQRVFRRSIHTMSSATSNVSPFTRTVIEAVRKLYPEKLADSSFDNTGLLLEAPWRKDNNLKPTVLLTIDLTKAVADEAIKNKNSIIIAYHPIIFRGLKSLTQSNSQQHTLLRLAQEGISVYCPHTAVDAAPNGINTWLESVVTTPTKAENIPNRATQPSFESKVITSVVNPPPGFETAGYGRIIRFSQPVPLSLIVKRIMRGLDQTALSIAVPQSVSRGEKANIPISSIGLCAGSGGSMLNNLDVDLLFTGELSHHEALAAIEQGKCVVTAFHSNTERNFLRVQMEADLHEALHDVLEGQELKDFNVRASTEDSDPYEIVRNGEDWVRLESEE